MTLTVGSLFSGIGGIDLGLERAGMKVRWQVELDPWCQKVLAKHWPDVERFADVKEVGAHNLAPVDLIAGGFPCQDLSYAGKGAGITGTRSGLWVEYARVIRELRPRYVLVENVPALLARGLGVVLGDLAACGYDAEWDCIPAAAVGAPHRRDRVWILAYAQGHGEPRIGPLPDAGGALVGAGAGTGSRTGRGHPAARGRDVGRDQEPTRPGALAHSYNGRRVDGQVGELAAEAGVDALGQPLAGSPDVANAAGQRWERGGSTWAGRHGPANGREDVADAPRDAEPGEPAPAGTVGERDRAGRQPRGAAIGNGSGWWIAEPNVGRVAHGVPQRVDRLRGLGNAVVPQVVEWIGRRIVEAEQAA